MSELTLLDIKKKQNFVNCLFVVFDGPPYIRFLANWLNKNKLKHIIKYDYLFNMHFIFWKLALCDSF